MKKILLWDPRFPGAGPARLTLADSVASACVRAGIAAAADPVEQGALLAGGPLDPGSLVEVVLAHGSLQMALKRTALPLSVATIAVSAGVAASTGVPIAAGAPAPAFTTSPSISGTPTIGQTLTGSDGTITNGTVSLRQWLLSGTVVASGATYVPDAAGSYTYQVTATGAGGSTAATSAAVTVAGAGVAAPTNTTAPAISGTATVGSTLTTDNGTWTGSPTYAYQWRRDGVDISGATASTYTLVTADASKSITARVAATNAGGTTTAVSNAIAVGSSATAPAAPTMTVTAGNAQNSIAWTDGSNGGAAITGHKLYRSTTTGFTPAAGNLVGTITSASPYLDAGTNGTAYYYRLSAVNSANLESGYSAEGTGTPVGTPTIAFANPSVSVTEGNTGTQAVPNTINVTRNGVTGALTVNLTYGGTANAGSDYVAGPASVTIANGANSASFDLTVNGDTAVESDETIVINAVLAAYSSATATKTITITNDDSAGTYQARHFASGVATPGLHSYDGNYLSNGTDTTGNYWSMHVNESGGPVSRMAPVYAGWANDASSEVDLPNAYTVYVAVEYPLGSTPQQILLNGAAACVIPPASNTVLDYLTLATAIPAGAAYRIRQYLTVSAGQKWPLSMYLGNGGGSVGGVSLAGVGETGVGLANKTMSGTVTPTGLSGLTPAAILTTDMAGTTVVMSGGQSHELAVQMGGPLPGDNNNIGIMGFACAGLCPVIQTAVGGTTAVANAASGKMARRLDLMTKAGVSHWFDDWGVNDFLRGDVQADPSILVNADLNIAAQVDAIGVKPIKGTTRAVVDSTKGFYRSADMTSRSTQGFVGPSSLRGYIHANVVRAKAGKINDYIEFGSMETGSIGSDSGIDIDALSGHARWPAVSSGSSVATGSTTTVIQSNAVGATGYFAGGGIVFTSGALSGTYAAISNNAAGGQITLSSALSAVPAAGDTFNAYPSSARPTPTGDGSHVLNAYGRIQVDIARAKVHSWVGVPVIAYEAQKATVTEGNTGTKTVTNTISVTRNGVTGALVVNLAYGGTATSGSDYAAGPATVTIPSGATSVAYDMTINADTAVESDETIVMSATLAAYPTSTASKTIFVTNDDPAVDPDALPTLSSGSYVARYDATNASTDRMTLTQGLTRPAIIAPSADFDYNRISVLKNRITTGSPLPDLTQIGPTIYAAYGPFFAANMINDRGGFDLGTNERFIGHPAGQGMLLDASASYSVSLLATMRYGAWKTNGTAMTAGTIASLGNRILIVQGANSPTGIVEGQLGIRLTGTGSTINPITSGAMQNQTVHIQMRILGASAAAVGDQAAGTIRLWINGTKYGTDYAYTPDPAAPTPSRVTFGSDTTGNTAFDGSFHHALISTALTDADEAAQDSWAKSFMYGKVGQVVNTIADGPMSGQSNPLGMWNTNYGAAGNDVATQIETEAVRQLTGDPTFLERSPYLAGTNAVFGKPLLESENNWENSTTQKATKQGVIDDTGSTDYTTWTFVTTGGGIGPVVNGSFRNTPHNSEYALIPWWQGETPGNSGFTPGGGLNWNVSTSPHVNDTPLDRAIYKQRGYDKLADYFRDATGNPNLRVGVWPAPSYVTWDKMVATAWALNSPKGKLLLGNPYASWAQSQDGPPHALQRSYRAVAIALAHDRVGSLAYPQITGISAVAGNNYVDVTYSNPNNATTLVLPYKGTFTADVSALANLSTTGDITNGSATIANVADVTGVMPGMAISGTGIPSLSYVRAISGNTITIGYTLSLQNQNATATTTGVALTITRNRTLYNVSNFTGIRYAEYLSYTGQPTGQYSRYVDRFDPTAGTITLASANAASGTGVTITASARHRMFQVWVQGRTNYTGSAYAGTVTTALPYGSIEINGYENDGNQIGEALGETTLVAPFTVRIPLPFTLTSGKKVTFYSGRYTGNYGPDETFGDVLTDDSATAKAWPQYLQSKYRINAPAQVYPHGYAVTVP